MEKGFSYGEAAIICSNLEESRRLGETYEQGWKRAFRALSEEAAARGDTRPTRPG